MNLGRIGIDRDFHLVMKGDGILTAGSSMIRNGRGIIGNDIAI
jgi:hypothetical protein